MSLLNQDSDANPLILESILKEVNFILKKINKRELKHQSNNKSEEWDSKLIN